MIGSSSSGLHGVVATTATSYVGVVAGSRSAVDMAMAPPCWGVDRRAQPQPDLEHFKGLLGVASAPP